FDILRYRTFTTEIYTEYLNFGPSTAGTLSIVLVMVSLAVLVAEGESRGGGRVARSAPMAARPPVRHHLGRGPPLALPGCRAVVTLALGVPFGEIVSLLTRAGRASLPGAVSLGSALGHTVLYSAPAGVIATAAAVPVAVLSLRHPSRLAGLFEKG